MLIFQKKITGLQCSWVRRLYDNSFHECKIIPLRLIENVFSNKYFENLFRDNNIDWKAIYTLPRKISYNTIYDHLSKQF